MRRALGIVLPLAGATIAPTESAACEMVEAAAPAGTIAALADALPEATVSGIAAGLHVTVALPDGHDEIAIREQARQHRIELETLSDFGLPAPGRTPALVLGYAQMPEDATRAGIRQLARAVRATHPKGATR